MPHPVLYNVVSGQSKRVNKIRIQCLNLIQSIRINQSKISGGMSILSFADFDNNYITIGVCTRTRASDFLLFFFFSVPLIFLSISDGGTISGIRQIMLFSTKNTYVFNTQISCNNIIFFFNFNIVQSQITINYYIV